ncbi:DUF397 domain-containing protein [Streptomyces sp. NPDC001215]
MNWRTSSYSGSTNECVEIADLADGGRAVRDTKRREGGYFCAPAAQWQAFIQSVKVGDFDQ